jgi:hypothetical protein
MLDAKNNVSITSAAVNGQTLTFEGVLSADGSSINKGNFKITGGCTASLVSITGPDGPGASWQTTALRLTNIGGSWSSPKPFSGPALSEQVTQSASPDEHGNYALMGTVTVQGSSCFTQGMLQSGSFVSGLLGRQVIKMNDGSTLDATLTVSNNAELSNPIAGLELYPGSITGGACNGPVNEGLQ